MNEVHEPKTFYGVVLSTNFYAGNFERQLTAYCTGQVGECGVGEAMTDLFVIDMKLDKDDLDTEKDPFWDIIVHIPDERGCPRPCSIYRGKKGYNDLVIYFSEPPSKEQVALITKRAKLYAKDPRIAMISKFDVQRGLKILGVHVIKVQTVVEAYQVL